MVLHQWAHLPVLRGYGVRVPSVVGEDTKTYFLAPPTSVPNCTVDLDEAQSQGTTKGHSQWRCLFVHYCMLDTQRSAWHTPETPYIFRKARRETSLSPAIHTFETLTRIWVERECRKEQVGKLWSQPSTWCVEGRRGIKRKLILQHSEHTDIIW